MDRPAQPPQHTGRPSTRGPQAGGPAGRSESGRSGLPSGHRRLPSPGRGRQRERSLLGWPVWLITRVVVPLVLLLAIGLGVGYVRLLNGPISLKMLAAPIGRAIAADLDGFGVSVEDAAVLLSEGRSLEFRLRNVRFTDADGTPVANAPMAAVRLNANALWQGRIAPARVILIEPQLLLQYTRERGLSLSFARSADAPPGKPATAAETEILRPSLPPSIGAQQSTAQRSNVPASSNMSAGSQPAGAVGKPIDLARLMAQAAGRDAPQNGTASYLRGVGLRNATIVFDNAGRQTAWQVNEAEFGINKTKQGNVIAGDLTLGSSAGPWRLNFVARGNDNSSAISLQAKLQDLVPRSIAETLPELAALTAFDFPVNGAAAVDLSPQGDVTGALIDLELGRGAVALRMQGAGALAFDGGQLKLRHDGGARRLELLPSRVRWGGKSAATIAGSVVMGDAAARGAVFDFATVDGVLGADDLGSPELAIEVFRVRGSYLADTGIELTEARFKLAGGEVSVAGRIPGAGQVGAPAGGLALQGRLSPMNLATLKAMWPALIAPGARRWVGRQMQQGRLVSGSFVIDDAAPGGERARVGASRMRLSVALEGADIRLVPSAGFSPVEIPRGLVRLEGNTLEVVAPDAAVVSSPQRRLPLKGGRLISADVTTPNATAELTFRAQGPLAAAVDLIEQQAQRKGRPVSLPGEGLDGRIDAQVRIIVPLGDALGPDDVHIEGKGRITDGKAKAVLGNYDVNGATIAFEVTEQLLDAKGELLVGGVPAKLAFQRIFAAADEEQPPLRLRANLDTADRAQLGLDLNDLVQGEVPIELTVTPRPQGEPLVQVRADLTNAELLIESLAWKKPPGRSALLQFDVVKAGKQRTELQNFKVVGDDVAIGGGLVIDGQNKVREFNFPGFTLNVVSRLDVQGVLRPDNVWDVKARGTSFDGRDFFQSLFSVGQLRDKPLPVRKDQAGLELKAEIDTVLGYQDLSLKGLKLQMSKRGGRLTAVTARGVVDGQGREAGKPLDVGLQQSGNSEPRRLVARSDDAGQVFRLVGFYPSMQGGQMRLDVNLDGRGPAEKTGLLVVRQFNIIGEPVTYDVPGTDTTPGQRPQRKTERPTLQFDEITAPFSVGHGQFVLDGADLRSPFMGVVLMGKVDYRAKTVELGGTYVPLQGLNSIVGYFPLIGPILAGPRGEGVFGTTFLIKGPMAHPEVLINPVSSLLPGFMREMMQMTNPTPRVTPREDNRPAGQPRPQGATRSFSGQPADASGRAKAAEPRVDAEAGWSSETVTTPAPQPARRK